MASFRDLLQKFNVPEELDEFDPEKHIGDIKDKVDAIEWQLDEWEAEAGMLLERWIKTLQKRRQSLLKAGERLSNWTLKALLEGGWEEMPGNARRVKVQDSPETIDFAHAPKAEDFFKYPKYVQQSISYKWLEETIQADIVEIAGVDGNGAPVVDKVFPVPGVTIKRGKHIRFYNAKKK